MNLAFPESDFTRFLDTVYGAGRVMNDGIDMSSLTGTLRTYSYLGPRGKDYIIEISTEVRTSLAAGNFGWMSDFFFRGPVLRRGAFQSLRQGSRSLPGHARPGPGPC